MQYQVIRKLQEQSGSYFVHLPKIWVEARSLKESDPLVVRFNGIVQIEPVDKSERKGAEQ